MRTSELTGAALDWAVAKCEGEGEAAWAAHRAAFAYSSTWVCGGPIIEREKLTVIYNERPEDVEGWRAIAYHTGDMEYGTTPLIAAMRCLVASKLGDEIDVPEELKGL